VGKGGQGRQECRPQAWRPAPHQNAWTIVGVGMSSQAIHRQDCRYGKPCGGRTHRSAPTDDAFGLESERRVRGTKADRNVGCRQECLTHKKSLPHGAARISICESGS